MDCHPHPAWDQDQKSINQLLDEFKLQGTDVNYDAWDPTKNGPAGPPVSGSPTGRGVLVLGPSIRPAGVRRGRSQTPLLEVLLQLCFWQCFSFFVFFLCSPWRCFDFCWKYSSL